MISNLLPVADQIAQEHHQGKLLQLIPSLCLSTGVVGLLLKEGAVVHSVGIG